MIMKITQRLCQSSSIITVNTVNNDGIEGGITTGSRTKKS